MLAKKLLTPFQKFVQIESLSGMLLFGATVIALIWANSPYADYYNLLWKTNIGFDTGVVALNKPLILWINDLLMAVFFFLIGLEIKREVLIGELNSVRKAVFPLFAAIGGMTGPLLVYLFLNNNPETSSGWGIPMATDIAFALAILKLLGNRVPLGLKVFLTAFAIIDDIGAVLIIAIFYSASIKWMLIVYALALIGFLGFLSHKHLYSKYFHFVVAVIVWFLFLKAGIHPTVAGVLLAFTIPVYQRMDVTEFKSTLSEMVNKLMFTEENEEKVLSKKQIEMVDDLETWTERFQSPLQHLEHKLHGWVAYMIMPIFALSNAGVKIFGDIQLDTTLAVTIALCLIIGNLFGVSFMSFLSLKLGITELPDGMNYKHIIGASFLAGVGFTMSMFIANLAFLGSPVFIDSAKVGILGGSFICGIIGYTILRMTGKKDQALAENYGD